MSLIFTYCYPEGDKKMNRSNRFGLSLKYGVIGFFGAPIGLFLASLFGLTSASTSYFILAIGGGIGGAVGGWIRQRSGKIS